MKTTKRILFTACGLFALLPLLTSCGKENAEPNRNNPDTPQPQQKHNVELVYSNGEYTHIELDTINKYNTDQNVDTIFLIPNPYNTFSTLTTNQLQKRVNRLRECHNVNPEKVFGKGELQLWNQSVLNNPEIVRFFADTLKYDVTYYNTTKSR